MRLLPPRLFARSAIFGFSASAVFVLCLWIAAVFGVVLAIQPLIDLTSAHDIPLRVLVEHAFPELLANRNMALQVLLACVWLQLCVLLTLGIATLFFASFRLRTQAGSSA